MTTSVRAAHGAALVRAAYGAALVRAAHGAALVLAPGPAIRLTTRRLPSRRMCRVARVLGARHLIQAALTGAAPEPRVLAAGGQVDAVHTASMLLLAAVSRAGRRAALTDALTGAAFAAAGFCVAGVSPGPSGAVDRGEFADRSAARPRANRERPGGQRAPAQVDVRDLHQADPE